jgi:hypothetical protein
VREVGVGVVDVTRGVCLHRPYGLDCGGRVFRCSGVLQTMDKVEGYLGYMDALSCVCRTLVGLHLNMHHHVPFVYIACCAHPTS